MKTVLFDMYYGIGHTYSSLKLANILRNHGYKVIFIGLERYCEPAVRQGFEFVKHHPDIVSSIELQKMKKHRSLFFEILYSFFSQARIKEARENLEKFDQIVNRLSPDVVLVDEEYIAKFIFYKQLSIPAICVQTMPEKSAAAIVPPFTSMYCPTEGSAISKMVVWLLWLKKILSNHLKYKWLSIKYLGQDDLSILKKIIKENGSDFSKLVGCSSSNKFSVKNESLLILSAVDFDFPREPQKNVFRVGPLKDFAQSNTQSKPPRFNPLCEKLSKLKLDEEKFVVFCSLGTVTFSYKKRLTCFFKKMKQVAFRNPDKEFVFSVSDFFETEVLYPIPTNVSVFPNLPQMELLKYCDLMVTHGGMNSITECIFAEVPMLVYPLSPKWDQPGNSARVVFHKLGLRGKINRDSPRTISKKINRIVDDYQFFLGNVVEMKRRFEKRNNSTEAINIIESIITCHERENRSTLN
jgi:UDP:flavonoid glycosyltransferase YjiC (YdhE family)